MHDGALLVNVALGPIVRTDALAAELESGRLRAALDVTEPEPLPPGHPLWKRRASCCHRTWEVTRPRSCPGRTGCSAISRAFAAGDELSNVVTGDY